jgi:hypothetical protein
VTVRAETLQRELSEAKTRGEQARSGLEVGQVDPMGRVPIIGGSGAHHRGGRCLVWQGRCPL